MYAKLRQVSLSEISSVPKHLIRQKITILAIDRYPEVGEVRLAQPHLASPVEITLTWRIFFRRMYFVPSLSFSCPQRAAQSIGMGLQYYGRDYANQNREGEAQDFLEENLGGGMLVILVLVAIGFAIVLWTTRCCGRCRVTATQAQSDQGREERRRFVEKLLPSKAFVTSTVSHAEADKSDRNRGIDDNVEANHNTSRVKMEEDEIGEDACAICLVEYKVNDEVAFSSNAPTCPHQFHMKCVKEWLLDHHECPICRNFFLQEDIDAKEGDEEAP